MSNSYSVVGIKDTDYRYQKMANIYFTCKEANVTIPDEVLDFFNDKEPNGMGVTVDITASMVQGLGEKHFDVDLKGLNKDIRYIRFTISY